MPSVSLAVTRLNSPRASAAVRETAVVRPSGVSFAERGQHLQVLEAPLPLSRLMTAPRLHLGCRLPGRLVVYLSLPNLP
jgi:hypothetical protein